MWTDMEARIKKCETNEITTATPAAIIVIITTTLIKTQQATVKANAN